VAAGKSALTLDRGLGQIVDITSPHFNEPGVVVLQRFKFILAQEAYRGQLINDGEALAPLQTGSFDGLQGVIPPWQ
jgi:hypothetical protein